MENVVIATITSPRSKTGVRAHVYTLCTSINNAGLECTVVNPFSGSKKWLPVFAVRRIMLDYINLNWSLRWYRYWHYMALYENLKHQLDQHPTTAVMAQEILSAKAALDIREKFHLNFKII